MISLRLDSRFLFWRERFHMFDFRLLFHKPSATTVDFTLATLHWMISWTYLWIFITDGTTNFLLLLGTLLMAALSGAAIMSLMIERRRRNSIIDSRVDVLTQELELTVIDLTTQARMERQRFQALHAQYVDSLVDIERLRDDFKHQMEDSRPEDSIRLLRKKTMLLVLGPDEDLYWDLAELEGMGMRIEAMHNPTTDNFKARLDAYRMSNSLPYYLHLAMHGNELGVKFANEIASPLWLRRQLLDVRHCTLGVCSSDKAAYQMRLVSSKTLCFSGKVNSINASRFILEFYKALLDGHSKDESFWMAKKMSPSEVSDLAMLV